MSEEEKLLDRSKSVKDLTKKELIFDHALLHHFFNLIKKGVEVKGWNLEDVVNQHKLIVNEMERRGIEHHITDPRLDNFKIKADSQLKSDLLQLRNQLPNEFLVAKNCISIVGSTLNEEVEPRDTDLLIEHSFKLEDAIKELKESLEKVDLIFSDIGPQGPSFPMYDLKLVKSKEEDIIPFEYEICLDRPFNREQETEVSSIAALGEIVYLRPDIHGRGIELQISKRGDEIQFFTEGIPIELPQLEKQIRKIKGTNNFFLTGWLRSDQKLIVDDILFWGQTQLINLPFRDRLTFLCKLECDTVRILPAIKILSDEKFEENLVDHMLELSSDWGDLFILRGSEEPYLDEVPVKRIKFGGEVECPRN
ncbi:MAG TPA: hypothetical protein EYP30_04355 [Archaeoglobaceae archaeon]|nr:hypothetical protein [Archaeoglobaceae archaeon]